MAMAKKINSFKTYLHTNRNFLLLLSSGALLLALSLYFFVPQTPPPVLSNTEEQNADIALQAFQGTGSVKCVIESGETPGTIYIKNGKVRFISANPKSAEVGNAILKGDTGYAWQEGAREGMKADTNNPLVQGYMSVDAIKEQIDKNSPVCIEEPIDDKLFTPPSDVVFSDVFKMLFK